MDNQNTGEQNGPRMSRFAKLKTMFRQLFKKLYGTGAVHITLGSFATKFVAFFGSIFVVRVLSKEDFGLLGYVENIINYATILAGFGLSYSATRYIIIESEDKKRTYYNYAVKHGTIRNIAIALILLVVNHFIEYPSGFKEAKLWMPVLAIMIPFQDLTNIGLGTLRAFFRNKSFAYLSFALSTVLILGRIVGGKFAGIGGVLWSRMLINAIFAVVIMGFIWRIVKEMKTEPLAREEKKSANIYGIQMMITNGLWALFMLNDTFLIGYFCNDPAVLADYKVAYVLPGNISLFSTAIGTYLAPYFTKNENDFDWVRRNYKKAYLLTAAIVGAAALLLIVLAKPLILMIYGEAYANVDGLMQVLLIASFANSGLRYTTANLLSAMGQAKYNMIVSFIGMILQIVLDIILIPSMQAMGVAVANCIVYCFMAIALFIIFYRKYFVKKQTEQTI